MSETVLSGGCQCGAVRYKITGTPQLVAICHCRMCQKATGSIAWPFFTMKRAEVTWTRGAVAKFSSSAAAERGYCASCGTPLCFEPEGEDTIDIGIGTLDDPAAMEPTAQYWVDTRVPWFGKLAGLPVKGLGQALPAEEVARRMPYQHPDHDTRKWPPHGETE